MRRADGFSIVELLVASAVTLAVVAGISALLNPVQAAFQSQTEAADVEQRLRVAAQMLEADIAGAGSGPDRGVRAGPLGQTFPPILPFRRGSGADDPPATAFADRITLVSVPPAAPSTTVSGNGPPQDSDWLGVDAQPECPVSDPLCLFTADSAAVVFDDSANVDLIAITAVSSENPTPMLQHANQHLTFAAYRPSAAAVTGVSTVSYAIDHQASQLVVSSGLGAPDAPAADNVVALSFAYLVDPQPPNLTTYGPRPPPIDVQGPSLEWPPGENCAFAVVAGAHVPRLPVLGAGSTLLPMALAQFTDGPWCPDSSSTNRWDADLLRVRAVVVTLRVQAAIVALRGPAGLLFSVAGTGRDSNRWVPDQEVSFQVTPRNLNLERVP